MSCTLELPLMHRGRPMLLHVEPSPDGQWMVSADVAGHEVVRECCSSWQRVERLRLRLERSAEPPAPDRRSIRGLLAASILLGVTFCAAPASALANAQIGDVIPVELGLTSLELRALVRRTLHEAGIDPRELVEDIARDEKPGAMPPVVGARFDWRAGNIMPPSVLHALPALAHPLEYRFVRSDLVVIDMETGVVQGVLWSVLPQRGSPIRRPSTHSSHWSTPSPVSADN